MTLKEFVEKWKSRVYLRQLLLECHPLPGTPTSDITLIMADFKAVMKESGMYEELPTAPDATQKAARA